MSADSGDPPRIAIVLSGGGARGAYEAGVLSYVLDELPEHLGHPVRFSIITGTSVGAIHACFLAATGAVPGSGKRLERLWREISLMGVYRLGAADLIRLPAWLLGFTRKRGTGDVSFDSSDVRLPGMLDTGPLEDMIASHVDWARIHANIEAGALDALAVSATEIATGRSVVFVDTREGAMPTWPTDPYVVARPVRIAVHHALASAAIPVLFPAHRIGGAFFCDGGLRLNTPLSPALRLGANRALVIGLRYPRSPDEEDRIARERELAFLNPTFLAGKVLNALLLDRVDTDVGQLRLMNEVIRTGIKEFGADFLPRMNRTVEELRQTPLRIVEHCFIQPSEDLGELAGECLRKSAHGRDASERLIRLFVRAAARGTGPDKDLLSYVLFDGVYSDRLLELGRKDAMAATDDLVRVLKTS